MHNFLLGFSWLWQIEKVTNISKVQKWNAYCTKWSEHSIHKIVYCLCIKYSIFYILCIVLCGSVYGCDISVAVSVTTFCTSVFWFLSMFRSANGECQADEWRIRWIQWGIVNTVSCCVKTVRLHKQIQMNKRIHGHNENEEEPCDTVE